ncbi:hypothetical protein [Mangrovimonas aestuarii]|uniref:hypothetical protein n=1 Tax=Mangrovimonas aestuarii TaxID=3018443 RepID=UPI002378ADE8|nr:hypothetical protein [Mangrovimonas aestuarii]
MGSQIKHIEALLEKYENGQTNLKEEQELKNYFSQVTIASHLEVYKPLFNYFSISSNEQYTKDVPLKTKSYFNYKWISVAVVVVLMFGAYFEFVKSPQQNDLGTIEDPQLAYNEVVKSLELMSNQFNKGASTVGYLDEIEQTRKLIFKD